MKKPKEDTLKLVEKLGIKLTVDDKEMHEKQLLKVRSTGPLPSNFRQKHYIPDSILS